MDAFTKLPVMTDFARGCIHDIQGRILQMQVTKEATSVLGGITDTLGSSLGKSFNMKGVKDFVTMLHANPFVSKEFWRVLLPWAPED